MRHRLLTSVVPPGHPRSWRKSIPATAIKFPSLKKTGCYIPTSMKALNSCVHLTLTNYRFKNMRKSFAIMLFFVCNIAYGQQPHRDQIESRPYKSGYFDNDILKGIEQFDKEEKPAEVKKPAY